MLCLLNYENARRTQPPTASRSAEIPTPKRNYLPKMRGGNARPKWEYPDIQPAKESGDLPGVRTQRLCFGITIKVTGRCLRKETMNSTPEIPEGIGSVDCLVGPVPAKYEWLTTCLNPRTPLSEPRGWRTHAVLVPAGAKFDEIKKLRSLCGLRPRHGWGMDLFIEEPCARCSDIFDRSNAIDMR